MQLPTQRGDKIGNLPDPVLTEIQGDIKNVRGVFQKIKELFLVRKTKNKQREIKTVREQIADLYQKKQ
ncbi:MAG TPA: hypothetical protein VJB99_03440 [Patescibacteria group bacterium]|nr:hypothetical protein [Patescibacteria group bacterium]